MSTFLTVTVSLFNTCVLSPYFYLLLPSILGYNNHQLSFLLKYEPVNGEKFSKIFKTPLETSNLTFIIGNTGNREEKKLQVSTERRMVEAFSITKTN